MRGSDEVGAARKMAQERRTVLLGREGIASGLVAVALDADDGDRAAGLALFRALIREAGEDRENRGSLGGPFLEEAAGSIEALVAREDLDADAALELTDAYARGEVEAPEALVAWLMARLDALARSEAGSGLACWTKRTNGSGRRPTRTTTTSTASWTSGWTCSRPGWRSAARAER